MKEPFRQKIRVRTWVLLLLIMLITSVLSWWVIDDGHDYRGDFAMYVSQAQVLLRGTTAELYEMNKFAMDNSDITLGPYLYQSGFPILLAGVLAVFGLNFYAMKALCAAGLVFSIPLMFHLFRPYSRTSAVPLLIIVMIASHSSYIIFTDSILSDLPFLFFSLFAFSLFSRKPTFPNQVALGFAIYFAYLIRDIGIVLLPALMAFHLNLFWVRSVEIAQKRLLAVPYLIVGLCLIIGLMVLPAGQENHLRELFQNMSGAQLSNMFSYYRSLIQEFFYLTESFNWVFYPIVSLIVVGCVSVFKRAPHFVVYAVLGMAILIIWPHKQGMRFLFPILPFMLFFIMSGLNFIFLRFLMGRKVVLAIAVGFTVFSIVQGAPKIREYAARDTNLCYTQEMQVMYEYMASEIPEGKLVGSYYPRVSRLFTGRNALRTARNNPVIDYNLTNKEHLDYTLEFFQVEFISGNEVLSKRIRPAE